MKSAEDGRLVRQIGLASGISVVIGSTIGSGIFKSPSQVAALLPGAGPMLAAWIVGGICVLCGALTVAEVGSAYPYSGGVYVFIREAFGRLPAFLCGWASLVLTIPAGIGAVALVFGEYALRLAGIRSGDPGFAAWNTFLPIAAIVVVTAANVFGVKIGTALQNVTVIAKLAGLAVLILLALAVGLPRSGGHFTPVAPAGSFSVSGFGLAMVSALWAYSGWDSGALIGGEIIDPRRNLARAIFRGAAIVMLVYVLANVAYLSVFSAVEISKSSIVAADTMASLIGQVGVTFIVVTVMISTFGTLSAGVLTNPRTFFAMGEDGVLFAPLARVHPRFKTPYISVISVGSLGIFYVLVANAFRGSKAFGALTNSLVIATLPFYILEVASVFVFRSRERRRVGADAELSDSLVDPVAPDHPESHPHAYRPSARTPLYPLVPLIFIASAVFLLVNAFVTAESMAATLLSFAIVLAGAPVYYTALAIRSARERG
jgi:amino acid transporter